MSSYSLADAVLTASDRFTPPAEALSRLRLACEQNRDVAEFRVAGRSAEGRPIAGILLGRGSRRGALIAGAHPDEPVGPETLRRLIPGLLKQRGRFRWLLEGWRLAIVPHINPDGEARNWRWIARWPSAEAYIDGVERDLPRDDMEFGFPAKRPENRIAGRLFRELAPVHLHMSLHGMGFSHGALLLIENHWVKRTAELRREFTGAVRDAGLPLHDHDRKGQKGFFYLGPGFSTTPSSRGMREFFRDQGERMAAGHFQLSSFELARSLGGNPLCLVTELPLFVLGRKPGDTSAQPTSYLTFQERLPEFAMRVHAGQPIDDVLAESTVRAVPLPVAVRLQLVAIELALLMRTRRHTEAASGT